MKFNFGVQSGPAEAPQRGVATLASDIAKLDYANMKARANPVRTFTESVPRLSNRELEMAYRSSGVIFKGVNKKARDAIRKGFLLCPDVENRDDRETLNAAASAWMRSVRYLPKAMQALREMFVFGDGFLELGYSGTSASDAEPRPSETLVEVYNVDPMALLPVKDEHGAIKAYLTLLAPETVPVGGQEPIQASQMVRPLSVRDVNRAQVRAWALGKGPLPAGTRAIHPKRIQHFQVNTLRDHPDGLGISVIEACYIAATAKLAGDVSAGDVLEWYSKGFFTLNIDYATAEELKAGREQLEAAKNARKNHFVGGERSHFDIKSPSIPNIKQFYDNFHLEIAAALEMPVMVLLGVQKGTVTGSETDLVDYYEDIRAFQELCLEGTMLEMMQRALKRADFSIEWVALYVNQQQEADTAFKRAQATTQLFNGKVLTRREALRFMRDGELPDPESLPDELDAYDVGPNPGPPKPSDPSQPAHPPADTGTPDDGGLPGP